MSVDTSSHTASSALRRAAGRTAVMGVLNVTPDSFFDGGRYEVTERAVDRARQMVDEGVDVIDVGGESTRPGADDVAADVEIRRTAPVIERIASLGVPVSIDTRKASVARAALGAGASIVNDVSGGSADRAMLPLIAERRVGVVLMHMRGTPKTMDAHASYTDVVAEVSGELRGRVDAALAAGVDESMVMVDPGLGFAKSAEQSIELLRRIDDLRAMGYPLVVGPSRKRFVAHVLGGAADDRLEGTLAVVAWCAIHRVDAVRVHDVKEARRVVDMVAAIAS